MNAPNSRLSLLCKRLARLMRDSSQVKCLSFFLWFCVFEKQLSGLNFQTWLMRVELLSIFKHFLGGDTDMVAKRLLWWNDLPNFGN